MRSTLSRLADEGEAVVVEKVVVEEEVVKEEEVEEEERYLALPAERKLPAYSRDGGRIWMFPAGGGSVAGFARTLPGK